MGNRMIGVEMKRIVLCAVMALCLVIAPVAAAGGSSVLDAYGTNGSKVVVQVKAAKASTASPSSTVTQSSAVAPSTLPFTGTDIALFLVAGASLLLLGGGLRRLGRDKSR